MSEDKYFADETSQEQLKSIANTTLDAFAADGVILVVSKGNKSIFGMSFANEQESNGMCDLLEAVGHLWREATDGACRVFIKTPQGEQEIGLDGEIYFSKEEVKDE